MCPSIPPSSGNVYNGNPMLDALFYVGHKEDGGAEDFSLPITNPQVKKNHSQGV